VSPPLPRPASRRKKRRRNCSFSKEQSYLVPRQIARTTMCREFVLGRRRAPRALRREPSSFRGYTNLNSVLKVDYAGPPNFRGLRSSRRYFRSAYYQLLDVAYGTSVIPLDDLYVRTKFSAVITCESAEMRVQSSPSLSFRGNSGVSRILLKRFVIVLLASCSPCEPRRERNNVVIRVHFASAIISNFQVDSLADDIFT